jgi:hypothetical protein
VARSSHSVVPAGVVCATMTRSSPGHVQPNSGGERAREKCKGALAGMDFGIAVTILYHAVAGALGYK